MRIEPHTGAVTLDCGGETITLCITWRVLARFRGAFGEGWDEALERALSSRDTEAIAGFLALATDKPAAWWLDREPAPHLVPVIRAMQAALMVAYFGPGGAPADPPTAAATTPPTPAARTWWRSLFGRGARAGATPAASGT
jgi:hypothetical protein